MEKGTEQGAKKAKQNKTKKPKKQANKKTTLEMYELKSREAMVLSRS